MVETSEANSAAEVPARVAAALQRPISDVG